ncbi:PRC-barrel domain containing protein [Streptomyces wuyuanensis]|uniref:PRC-barrel domain-containing protein n=1 Tax=Streptomyces wuyuanensis TaxID=1196353 RepID=A0A1G9XC94_9ACTN|nr:PRC-barrel domain-containing protein [Streptomyces wuyuanensis]SDM94358.1 PRC-barrel domain-containing protein [Streptomyces wuyuanensis]
MLFTQAKGRNVIALTTAESLATVTGIAIAPAPARIAAVRVKTRGPGTQVTWNDVHSFGPDAVTVRTPDTIQGDQDTTAPTDKHHDPIGKRLLTETGQNLGSLDDIDFDETTGHIKRLIMAGQDIPGERLLGAGTYAIAVAAP